MRKAPIYIAVVLVLLAVASAWFLVPKMFVGDGEAITFGRIETVDSSSRINGHGERIRLCRIQATYVVDGRTYHASAGPSELACENLGGRVTVIYTVAAPADAHITTPIPWVYGLWLALLLVPAAWRQREQIVTRLISMTIHARERTNHE